jgi:thiamine-monophosphate kinase
MTDACLTVADLGERGLLTVVQPYCLAGTVGDDAAVLPAPRGQLVVTSDVLVEGVHFSDRTTPPYAVGWRAAAANLSDLAAMGAAPLSLVVALGLSAQTPVAWVEQVYEGLTACCRPWQTGLVGGDLSRSEQRFLAIAAMGDVPSERVIRRSQARPGDWLVATGAHGSARAGLELLLHPERATSLSEEERQNLIAAHQFPQPRLDLLPLWPELWELGDRIGGMDTSDGLADAIVQVCQASGVGAEIDPACLPQSPALTQGFPLNALEWSLYGGEDFELLLSLPPRAAEYLLEHVPTARAIGTVVNSDKIELVDMGDLTPDRAFQHFQSAT